MPYNKANMGYIPAMVLSNLAQGREVRIIGGINLTISTMEGYRLSKKKLKSFGEIIGMKGNTVSIATRSLSDCPDWILKIVEEKVWDAPEAFRWKVPPEMR